MRNLTLVLIGSLMFVSLLTSCKKEGPAGPQGVAGEQGPQGEQGERGPQGAKGSTGTANVLYSAWFKPSSYEKTTVFGSSKFSFDKPAPKITQKILNSGTILTYGKLEGYATALWPKGQVGQLPIALTYVAGGTQVDTWSAYATVGNLRINFVNSTNYYFSGPATIHSFRYIIIPGAVTARQSAASPDLRDYEAVCEYYGIPE